MKKRKNLRIFIIFLVLLIAVILLVNYTSFDKEKEELKTKLSCDIKAGGVSVGDVCYNCGDSDGVCPEDFEGVICRVEDPDCS